MPSVVDGVPLTVALGDALVPEESSVLGDCIAVGVAE